MFKKKKKKVDDLRQKCVLEVCEDAEGEESGFREEEETKEKRERSVRGRKREQVGNREQREPCSIFFSCISFLDSCLLDDRIKESFNMTPVLDINRPHTSL